MTGIYNVEMPLGILQVEQPNCFRILSTNTKILEFRRSTDWMIELNSFPSGKLKRGEKRFTLLTLCVYKSIMQVGKNFLKIITPS